MSVKTLIRGGQVFLHNVRMLRQVTARLFFLSWIISSILCFVILMWCGTTSYQRSATYAYVNASVQTAIFNPHAVITVFDADNRPHRVSANAVMGDPNVRAALAHVIIMAKCMGILSLLMGLFISGFLMARVLTHYGERQTSKQKLRGSDIVSNAELTRALKKAQKDSDLTLGTVPLLKGAEWGHFLLHGTTGAGKSTYLYHLLDQVRHRGDRNIVYCKSGDFVRRYYRPGKDIILNALDARSQCWDLWLECNAPYDFDELAKAMIPMPSGVDPFWVNGARMILSAAAWQMRDNKDRSAQQLLKQLLVSDLSEVGKLLQGTEAASLVSDKIEKTAVSIKAVLATYLKCLRYVRDDGEKFSIRNFIQQDYKDSWLFITSGGRQHEALKPLITLWLNLAGTALLDLVPNYQRRIWMTLDELPSLQQLPFLLSQLAEVRKFGGCMVLGAQNIAHLRTIYGSHAAQAISDLCNTRVFLHSNDAEVARWVSMQLGDVDEEEVRESISYGASTLRDGVSLSRTRQTRPIVMPAEIQNLNEREGYLKLPGSWPATRLQLPVLQTQRDVAGFIETKETQMCDPELDTAIQRYTQLYPLLKKDDASDQIDSRQINPGQNKPDQSDQMPPTSITPSAATSPKIQTSTTPVVKLNKSKKELDIC